MVGFRLQGKTKPPVCFLAIFGDLFGDLKPKTKQPVHLSIFGHLSLLVLSRECGNESGVPLKETTRDA